MMRLVTTEHLQTFFKKSRSTSFSRYFVFFFALIMSVEASAAVGDIASTPVTNTSVNSSYSYALSCVSQVVYNTQVSSPYACTGLSLVTAPAGMTITSTGPSWQPTLKIIWTPSQSQVGNHTVKIKNRVAGAYNTYTNHYQTYTLTVANRIPVISSTANTVGNINVAYQYQVVATDDDGHSLNYSLPTAPSGMNISSSGLVTWTPSVFGNYPVTVKVSDGYSGGNKEQNFTIDVINNDPIISSQSTTTAYLNTPYSYQVAASDSDGQTLTYSLTNSAAGMTISSSGLLSWPEPQLGTENISLLVSDGFGGTAQQDFTVQTFTTPFTGTDNAGLFEIDTTKDPDTAGNTPGEFSVSSDGSAFYTMPIGISPGTAGMEPALALTYNNNSGNGVLGMGWTLGGLTSLTRCGSTLAEDSIKRGIDLSINDHLCLEGERLISVSSGTDSTGAYTEYRKKTDPSTRIRSYGLTAGQPDQFRVWTKTGQIFDYGFTADSRIEVPNGSEVITWAVNKIADTVGNYLTVSYTEDNANGDFRPDRIDYTANDAAGLAAYNSVRFSYEDRTDNTAVKIVDKTLKVMKRLTAVQAYAGNNKVHEYSVAYGESPENNVSIIDSITECVGDGTCLQPTTFNWQTATGSLQYDPSVGKGIQTSSDSAAFGDVNGDGYLDIVSSARSSGSDITTMYLQLGTTNGEFGTTINIGTTKALCTYDNVIGNIYTVKDCYPISLGLGDVNGDGNADLVYFDKADDKLKLRLSMGTGFNAVSQSFVTGTVGNLDFGDVNGDGNADLVYASYDLTSSNFSTSAPVSLRLSNGNTLGGVSQTKNISRGCQGGVLEGYTCTPVNIALGDVNGDGADDLVVPKSSELEFYVSVFLSNGSSFAAPIDYDAPRPKNVWLDDINGDGLADLVSIYGGTIYMQVSTGSNFGSAAQLGTHTANCVTVNNGPLPVTTCTAFHSGSLSDINGDGLADFISVGEGGYDGLARVRTVNLPTNDLLTNITNSLGITTTINYSQLDDSAVYTQGNTATFPNRALSANYPMNVVASVETPNGLGDVNTASYHYTDAKQDLQGRGFLGFASMAVTDSTAGVTTTTDYRQDYPYAGQVHSTKTKLADSTIITEVENTLATKSLFNGDVILPYVSESVQAQYEIDAALISSSVTTYTLDDMGNNTDIVVAISGENTQLDANGNPLSPTGFDTYTTHTVNTYLNDETNWFIGRLTQVENTQTMPDATTGTRMSAFSYDAVTGLLSQEIVEPNNATLRLVTDYQYDVYGNKTTVSVSGADIASRSSTTTWGERTIDNFANVINNGRFAVSTTNALGHSEQHAFDTSTGAMTQLRGPNGLDTSWEYDIFGRPLREIHADGTVNATFRAWCSASTCPANGLIKTMTMSTGSVPSVQVSDALGRNLVSASLGRDGRVIYIDTEYNARSEITRKSLPYFSGDTVYWNSFAYDVLGRVYAETSADGSTNTTGFHGLATTITNSLGQANERTKNVRGEVVQVFDADVNDTYYRYDAFGNLIETEDADGNIISNSYDIRGRKTAMNDPDMGSWTYNYNALGELTSQTDAKGQTVTMTYDLLGRMITRTETEGTSNWVYDTATNGTGKLHTETGAAGDSKTLNYDSLGRATTVSSSIESSNYAVATSYDNYSRISQIIYPTSTQYPTGLTVDYNYSEASIDGADGFLKTVTNQQNNTVYWHAKTQNAAGQLTEITLGNGITSQYNYTATTNIISTIRSFTPGNESIYDIQNLGYEFDTIGNLTKRSDYGQYIGLTALYENFSYDNLNRMTGSTVYQQSNKSYGYDALGNITSKTGVGSYTYGTNAGPHAVTQTNNNGVLTNYIYDANGNMTSGNNRTIAYNSYNKPNQITNSTADIRFTYGANRARIIRKNITTGKTRHYIGNLFEQETHNSITTYTHYIKAGGRTVAIETSKSDLSTSTHYLHKDHLGSITAITDHNGLIVEQQSYDPHGKRRNNDWTDISGPSTPSATTDRGFTGHEHIDEVGLVHMNGRAYDPTLGRFISADPNIQSPLNSQSLNRYSYVMNNPLSFTDPSGFFFKKLFKSIFGAIESLFRGAINFIKSLLQNKVLRTIVSIAVLTLGPEGYVFLKGFAAGYVGSGGDLKAGIVAALSAGAIQGIGTHFNNLGRLNSAMNGAARRALTFGEKLFRSAAHGVVAGVGEVIQGGKFAAGFLSSGVNIAFSGSNGGTSNAPTGGIRAFANGVKNHYIGQAVGRLARKVGLTTSGFNLLLEFNSFIGKEIAGTSYYRPATNWIEIHGFFSRDKIPSLGVIWDINDTILGYQGLIDAVGYDYIRDGGGKPINIGHSLGSLRATNLVAAGAAPSATIYSLPFGNIASENVDVTNGAADLVNGGIFGSIFNPSATIETRNSGAVGHTLKNYF
jgi:RHS repeat-associated protein